MIGRLLKSWYKEIPAFKCNEGCMNCCLGYAPAMSKWEWEQINHPGKFVTQELTNCPFLTASGCAIYAKRPLICRLYGTVDGAALAAQSLGDLFPLNCHEGCGPDNPLPVPRAVEMSVTWQRLIWRKFADHLRAWQIIIETGPLDHVPPKFEWLRYMMATQEGRRAVCQDIMRMTEMPIGGKWVPVPPRMSIEDIDRLENVLHSQ